MSVPTASSHTARPKGLIEPWFSAYALAGLLINGMVPIMIPVTTRSQGPFAVALTIAAFSAGQLAAPSLGRLADRRGWQRRMFLATFPVMSVTAFLFAIGGGIAVWAPTALVAGTAAGAAQTLASLFVVESHPRAEWDTRVGWFRLTFGVGQVGGLAIGAVFADGAIALGWIVAGAAILCGTLLGTRGLPHLTAASADPVARSQARVFPVGSRRDTMRGPFALLWVCLVLAMTALHAVLNVMPLVVHDAFGLDPSLTARIYLYGSVGGALLYPVCGAIAHRIHARRVFAIGLVVTTAGFAVMAASVLWHVAGVVVAPLGIVLIALAYPFWYLGAHVLAAELTAGSEGSALGLFNAAVAGGALVGAIAPAALADAVGYAPFLPLSAGLMLIAIAIGLPVMTGRARAA